MGKIVFHKITLLYCLILVGCAAGNSVLHIQTYPRDIPENGIGNFDISFRRYSFNRFWSTIDYDLNNDVLLHKDSVTICYRGQTKNVVLFKDDDSFKDDDKKILNLSGKGTLIFRFYPEYLGFTKVMQGDTVMLHTKNALFTPSGVFPLDSVRFIQGEQYKFKDNFVKWKGKTEYGFYKISL